MNFGCSSFSWDTEDGKHLLGRTYDQFGDLSRNKIAVIPRGHRMRLEINPSSQSWAVVKYAFCGMAILGQDTPIMVDGINENGFMGVLLNLPDYAAYRQQAGSGRMTVNPGFLVSYLLARCGSVEELMWHLPRIQLTEELVFGCRMSVHYMFSDRTGEAVVVESGRDGMNAYRHSIGVLTNSPDYPWHLTNLCNYTGVSNLPIRPRELNGIRIAEFGENQGGGMGLPGDYSSPSRFVRMAFIKEYAVKGVDELDGISKMFHNFAAVDIPRGIIRAGDDSEDYDLTLCIAAMCAESRTYYFATAENRRISAVRLEPELGNTQIKYFALPKQQDVNYLNGQN
ncbi:MAG: linear amide C-N hydrolase [Lachnospiraceae bacterium]|nr:linear amide C-N hydrolase [Lachnospiraceae bacterium]